MAASPRHRVPRESSAMAGHELLCLCLKSFYGLEYPSPTPNRPGRLARGWKSRLATMFRVCAQRCRRGRPGH